MAFAVLAVASLPGDRIVRHQVVPEGAWLGPACSSGPRVRARPGPARSAPTEVTLPCRMLAGRPRPSPRPPAPLHFPLSLTALALFGGWFFFFLSFYPHLIYLSRVEKIPFNSFSGQLSIFVLLLTNSLRVFGRRVRNAYWAGDNNYSHPRLK